jgi:hypothetical protein
MINGLFFKQPKPLTVKILGTIILILTATIIYVGVAPLSQLIGMSIIGIVLLGYSIS